MSLRNKILVVSLCPLIIGIVTTYIMSNYFKTQLQSLFALVVFLAIIVLGTVAAFVISKSITDPIKKISINLLKNLDDLSKISEQLTSSSGELSATSTEQASATQESVAAMEEMKSMIGYTHEYARNSQQTTNSVSVKATEGNTIMEELSRSMTGIERANADMANMGVIIEHIRKKTDIINEIVFKTQLLSFNASIEAARAGQHGKGFAVVAEEVGNLAKMSGTAAQEIAELLVNSNKEVNKIIESTRASVEGGIQTSQAALEIFSQIKADVIQVDGQVKGIVQASNEQQEGVIQTSKALTQLGDAASNNNNLALKTMDDVGNLKEIRDQVKLNIKQLIGIINTSKVQGSEVLIKSKLRDERIISSNEIIDNKADDKDFDTNFERYKG